MSELQLVECMRCGRKVTAWGAMRLPAKDGGWLWVCRNCRKWSAGTITAELVVSELMIGGSVKCDGVPLVMWLIPAIGPAIKNPDFVHVIHHCGWPKAFGEVAR